MTAHAHTQPDYYRRRVDVYAYRRLTIDGESVLEVPQPPADVIWERRPEASLVAADVRPLLSLDDDMARAVLDALAGHFGGVQGVRNLRADYDAERKRVDQLIEHLGVAAVAGRLR
ncbi:hypothetical protein [Dactylosporangium sp. CS-033363]|uniref:hypothetical protein n=1 Tax=Dactylosporangium sp. CS-033363 TaxID=3239935 RepID=UPI003D930735